MERLVDVREPWLREAICCFVEDFFSRYLEKFDLDESNIGDRDILFEMGIVSRGYVKCSVSCGEYYEEQVKLEDWESKYLDGSNLKSRYLKSEEFKSKYLDGVDWDEKYIYYSIEFNCLSDVSNAMTKIRSRFKDKDMFIVVCDVPK